MSLVCQGDCMNVYTKDGKERKNLTTYQRTHRPVRSREARCTGGLKDGQCVDCGRFLRRKGPHKPNVTGSLGWIHQYADGSWVVAGPGESIQRSTT